ncbi:MAG TPA: energy transducer TonB [Terracidiphilus sp.]|nr:energy transducer TonB [Terracidiphilus sp.]
MFEDSTFESTGRIHTRSRDWMIAACAFNGSILLSLILIPLIYPEALPRMAMVFLMEVPKAPAPEPKPVARVERTNLVQPQMRRGQVFAPSVIPTGILLAQKQEILQDINPANMDTDGSGPGGNNPFGNQNRHPVVREQIRGPVRVSGMVVEGLLVQKTMPIYPAIAVASRTQGTVVLQATISRNGTIENLRVASGPTMLQKAAMDAVRSWRYRPYLLSGEPVEVETTVNVVFKLQE